MIRRIALRALPRALEHARLYGLHDTVLGQALAVDALRVDFDAPTCLREFGAAWPAGSPAALSYRRCVAQGLFYGLDQTPGRTPAAIAACA